MLTARQWKTRFPCLTGISEEVTAILDKNVRPARFEQGAQIFGPDRPVQGLILPVSGTIRVQRQSGAHWQSLLYPARSDETCALMAACHLTFENRAAEAIAETDVEIVLVPRAAFDELMSVSTEFRAFVFAACSKRISDLFVVIEETVASRFDIQLAAKLMELCDTVRADVTDDELSVELGTSPQVVSQHLAEFERRGWVALGQGSIEFRDTAAIRELAGTSTL